MDVEARSMSRTVVTRDEQDLERGLLIKSIDALSADRSHCADCGRSPLVGELLHVYSGGVIVCELCRQLRRDDPESSERVRHSESGNAVRVKRLRPA
jgi:hypothetical protein